MLYMQPNPIHQALQILTNEIHKSDCPDRQFAFSGLQAELIGDIQGAIDSYVMSNHAIAKIRLEALIASHQVVMPYMNVQIQPSYPVYHAIPPSAPHLNMSSVQPISSTALKRTVTPPPAEKVTHKKRKKQYDSTEYTDNDVAKCSGELSQKIEILKKIHEESQHVSGWVTKQKFSTENNLDIKKLHSFITLLKSKSLLARWPKLTPFGIAVVNYSNQPAVIATPAAATPAKTFLPMQQLAQTRTQTMKANGPETHEQLSSEKKEHRMSIASLLS